MNIDKRPKKTIHVYMDSDVANRFEQVYTHCRNRFIQRAMKMALEDPDFFTKIFFSDVAQRLQILE